MPEKVNRGSKIAKNSSRGYGALANQSPREAQVVRKQNEHKEGCGRWTVTRGEESRKAIEMTKGRAGLDMDSASVLAPVSLY